MNRTTGSIRQRRRAWSTLAAIAATFALSVAIAACGSDSSGSTTPGGHSTQAEILNRLHQDLLRFAGCMRSHGVPSFPDPASPASDKEFLLGQIPGINTQAPAFLSAHTACKHLLPGGGSASQGATAQVMAQLLRISRCMRAHGLAAFPDPTASAPTNQSAYLDVAGFGANNAPPSAPPVAYLAIPNSINPNSPAAEHAATACHFRLK
jgi:hypothetical protein